MAMLRDIFACHKGVGGRGSFWSLAGKNRNTAKHSTMHRTNYSPPHIPKKNDLPQNVHRTVLRLGNPL